MTSVEQMLDELTQEAMTTRRVLERVPAAQLAWRPHPRARTLGELAAHIATLPGAIAEMATLDTFDVSDLGQPPSVPAEQLLAVLDDSLSRARAALSRLDNDRLLEIWRMVAHGKALVEMPRRMLLRSIMLNHWYHHRGQLTVYLRELGVAVPSIYGPSADETPFPPSE